MYLARKRIKGTIHYIIRESYKDHDFILSRDLFYLGTEPDRYIVYPGGNTFYIDEIVEDRLKHLGLKPAGDELENIFWPFIKPDIKRAQQHFRQRGSEKKTIFSQKSLNKDFHLFDRRRVHFLRYGQMDQGKIGLVSPRLFKILHHKSRDEIEQYFMESEQILRPHEIKTYIFVIFDLQKHFNQSYAKTMPQALDQTLVDEYFIKEICRLNKEEDFWTGAKYTSLNEYLIRYLVMFYDNEYGRSTYLEDIYQEWMDSRRDFRFSVKKTSVSMDEASTIFGISETRLRQMTKKELTNLYRQKAQEIHPDKGGDHDAFIRLSNAYQDIKGKKSKVNS
ncbi:chaperone J domain-containing protein [Desulfonema limicola]|uniref:Chaperone J domain-containing protein n=1 Tax=Desulfonema limicola TaxID=45656 RepID=A0A975B6K4_9BACT|nr:J domain-containing protein [Desulfonema limicola]QTA79765.1 chaperone J domain-containing protein [Desulfonema limicola]